MRSHNGELEVGVRMDEWWRNPGGISQDDGVRVEEL